MSTVRTNEDDIDENLGAEPLLPAHEPTPDHRLRWPESLAITVALLLGGAVASGLFRPMLPWLG